MRQVSYGKRHGIYLKYNSNGQLIEKKIYKAGNIDGEWLRYFDDGSVIEKKIYKNGKLIETIKP